MATRRMTPEEADAAFAAGPRTLVLDGPAVERLQNRMRRTGKAKLIRGEHPAIAAVRAKRKAPSDWVADLRTISERSETVPWLDFMWHERAQRWTLVAKVPDVAIEGYPNIPPEMRERLAGAPWWELPPTEQVGRKQIVSAYQWEMYRTERVWARPFWCLQGNAGGTPAMYTDLEKAMLKATGQPVDVPPPGLMAYAPWDSRAKAAVVKRDRLLKENMSLARLMQAGDSAAVKAEMEMAAKEARKAFFDWWSETMIEQTEFLTWYTRKTEADRTLRPASSAETRAAAQLKDTYLETGVVPSGRTPGLD